MHDPRDHATPSDRTSDEATAYFDGLAPVGTETLRGTWKGSGFPSGHPFDGSLERFGWFGKRFDGDDAVFPLLFTSRSGRLVAARSGELPFGLAMRLGLAESRAAAAAFRALVGLLATRRPSARLRMVGYRGVVSASMIYDGLPIIDLFRRIDDDTLLGAMDYRGFERPFFFVLERDRSA